MLAPYHGALQDTLEMAYRPVHRKSRHREKEYPVTKEEMHTWFRVTLCLDTRLQSYRIAFRAPRKSRQHLSLRHP